MREDNIGNGIYSSIQGSNNYCSYYKDRSKALESITRLLKGKP